MSKDLEEKFASGAVFNFGTVVGVRGIQGELKIRPATNNPELLLDVSAVRVLPPNGASFLQEIESLYLDKRLLMTCLESITDRNEAERLVGAKIEALREELRPLEEEEFWMKDLVGLDVFTVDGGKVGKIVDVLETPGYHLEISVDEANPKKTALIPFVSAIVPVVDVKRGRIEIVDLPGLLDL